MTLLYDSPDFLRHDTGPSHPERAERLVSVWKHLNQSQLGARCARPAWYPVSPQTLERVHPLEYGAELSRFARQGGGRIEVDTVLSQASYEVALLAAGAACDAVLRVLRGEDRNAFCLVRPPGHHALSAAPMGFCLFNHIALAARTALAEEGLDRVLVVDFDVHHGNGTQEIFWEDDQVGFLSIHRWPFYPGTGAAEETGSGRGLGYTANVPLPFGISRQAYQDQFSAALERIAERVKPQLVLVSAGFDAHREDPIGSLGLETEDYTWLTEKIAQVAETFSQGRIVSLLEGGYNVERLGECVEAHLKQLIESCGPGRPTEALF